MNIVNYDRTWIYFSSLPARLSLLSFLLLQSSEVTGYLVVFEVLYLSKKRDL